MLIASAVSPFNVSVVKDEDTFLAGCFFSFLRHSLQLNWQQVGLRQVAFIFGFEKRLAKNLAF